jgi:transcriptional repressor of cell division inhibition gene dicB
MRTEDVLAHYGSQTAAAQVLGITRAAVGQWGDVVPFISALRLESLTGGKLQLNHEAYDEKGRPVKEA